MAAHELYELFQRDYEATYQQAQRRQEELSSMMHKAKETS
jgi:hypothetical protein